MDFADYSIRPARPVYKVESVPTTYKFVVFFRSKRATAINEITLEDCLGVAEMPRHNITSTPRNWDTVWE